MRADEKRIPMRMLCEKLGSMFFERHDPALFAVTRFMLGTPVTSSSRVEPRRDLLRVVRSVAVRFVVPEVIAVIFLVF
jgi:hypothetical protein